MQSNVRELTKRIFSTDETTSDIVKPLKVLPADRLFILHQDMGNKSRFIVKLRSHHPDTNNVWRDPSFSLGYDFPNKFRMFDLERLEGKDEYTLPVVDNIAIILTAIFPNEQIIWANDDGHTQKVFNRLLKRFVMQNSGMEQRVLYREKGVIPVNPMVLERSELPLNAYQKACVSSFLFQEAVALFMEQGTGKTATTISLFASEAKEHFEQTGELYNVIILCPKNLRENWKKEIRRFCAVKSKITVIRGTEDERMQLLARVINPSVKNGEILNIAICSYDAYSRSSVLFNMVDWNRAVLDESHYIKEPKTKRTKSVLTLRDSCERRTLLSGTPVNNGIKDLYCQLEFLGEGLSGFPTFEKFRAFYEQYEENENARNGVGKVIGFKNLPFLHARLARLAFVYTKKEALPNLPEKMYSMEEVSMTKEQYEMYCRVQDELKIEIEDAIAEAGENVININHILTMMMKLAQVTSGHIKTSDICSDEGKLIEEGKIIYLNPNPKIDALMEIVKELEPEEKIIVWACFRADIRRISEELKAHGVDHVLFYGETKDEDREIAKERFNCDPNCRVFVANPRSAREGLNLWGYNPEDPTSHTNTTKVIYFSQDWSMVNRKQSEDRCHRIGTRVPVQYIDLVIPKTIDEQIRQRVVEKGQVADSVQDLREITKSLFKTFSIGDE